MCSRVEESWGENVYVEPLTLLLPAASCCFLLVAYLLVLLLKLCPGNGGDKTTFAAGLLVQSMTVTLANCMFSGNVGATGVALSVLSNTTVTGTNITLRANVAVTQGGALFVSRSSLFLSDSVLANNSASLSPVNGSSINGGAITVGGGEVEPWYGCMHCWDAAFFYM